MRRLQLWLVLAAGALAASCGGSAASSDPAASPSPSPPVAAADPIPVPVLELRYFPTRDGVNLDPVETTYGFTLAGIRARVQDLSAQVLNALEQGSVYVRDAERRPALDYSILDSHEILAAVPLSAAYPRFPDYLAILNAVNVCDQVDNRGVREVWIWMYHTERTVIDESNMAMGQRSRAHWNHGSYGNVSNSYQRNDLPVCQNTYTVYDYNYSRGLGEALENHGHQIDVVLQFVDRDFYWGRFVEPYGRTDGTVNHCGWTHIPPNGRTDYDWRHTAVVASNCSDWHPDGTGQVEMVSCQTWGCPDDSGAAFKVWLMQRLPGRNNGLRRDGKPLRNWWEFIGDFDRALAAGRSL
jgi:hypothetical protein